jgi:hypothetical protein
LRFVPHRHCAVQYTAVFCTTTIRVLPLIDLSDIYASKPETEPHRTQPVEILRLRRAVVIDREHASGEASCY